jgi:hypothetical protein
MDCLGGKVPVVVRREYTMALEYTSDLIWFHSDVYKWSKEIKKKYLEDLKLLEYLVGVPIVALVEEDNTKLIKFGSVTGWEVMNKLNLNNGKVGLVYTRSKNG